MKTLVTGGAGFIGSHLVECLLADGHHVIVLDDFSEGRLKNLPMGESELNTYNVSILDDVADYFDGIDVVFHLAALTRPQQSIEEPKRYNETNVTGTLNVLLACQRAGVKRLVFASSASIYGEQEIYPLKENMVPNPLCPYALHKQIGELYCRLFGQIYGLETNCLRFFNVYGTRMNPDSNYAAVIPRFIKLVSEGKSPTIFGDGEQSRDFTYIDDVTNGLLLAAKSDKVGGVFNIGSGTTISVNDVFELVCQATGKKVKPIYGPAVIEPRVSLADITETKKALGWEPKVSLSEGIERLVN